MGERECGGAEFVEDAAPAVRLLGVADPVVGLDDSLPQLGVDLLQIREFAAFALSRLEPGPTGTANLADCCSGRHIVRSGTPGRQALLFLQKHLTAPILPLSLSCGKPA